MYFWTSVFIQDQLLWSVVFALYNMFTALIFTKLYFFSIILGIFVFLSSSDCLLEFVLQIVFLTVDFFFITY